jgi:sugar lactone lactonase YvrE
LPEVRFIDLPGDGPEDVRFDAAGRVLTGLADGSIVRLELDSGDIETVANSGGRPLGLAVLPDGDVLVADSRRGLLRADLATGSCDVLADEVGGRAVTFASNVVADSAGVVYFTSSSKRFDLDHWRGDIIEHSCTGRLLRRDPSGRTAVLIEGIAFANGVALAPDESHLVFAETGGYRLHRFWLSGPRQGSHDVLVENMPGFPDNISVGSDGLIWVAMASPRNPLLDRLHRLPGFVRQVIWLLPHRWQPEPESTTWVIGYDFEGQVVHDLQAPDVGYPFVTGVAERDGRLVLGSLYQRRLAVTSVPPRL